MVEEQARQRPRQRLAVVMRRRETQGRWASVVWEAIAVLPGYAGADGARELVNEANGSQWLHPGFELVLHKDEAEGYYLNVSTSEPRVFVLWRMEEERAVPQFVTVSYNEAMRWMDGGEQVDSVAMPGELYAWVGAYVEANYRPEPKKRIKPKSFMHPKDRGR